MDIILPTTPSLPSILDCKVQYLVSKIILYDVTGISGIEICEDPRETSPSP